MHQEPLRFKKSRRSAQTNCVEVAHTLRVVRDSKNPAGPALLNVDITQLIASITANRVN